MPRKEFDVHEGELPKGKGIPIQEVSKHRALEQVAENDLTKDAIELEAFMNDELEIMVQVPHSKEENPVIVPNVNGINQPIIRGVKSKVKRKYVEALARSVSTRYSMRVSDPSNPQNIEYVPEYVYSAPFTVVHDPSPKGREWLEGIIRSAAA